MRRLIIMWQRFGPYHYARLAASSRILAEYGWELVGLQVSNTDEYEWSVTACECPCKVVTLFPHHGYLDLSRKQIARQLEQVFAEINPDAVAINGWSVPEAVAAAAWCRRNGRLAILMCGTHQQAGTRVWWKEVIKGWRVRRFAQATASGRWHADYLAHLGMSADRISIGYDTVDNEFIARQVDIATANSVVLRAKLNLPQDYFFVNTRFLARKNVDGVLRAFAKLIATEPYISAGWEVVISGSGERGEDWKILAKKLGVAERVRWCGFVQYESLPAYYALARVFVHVAHSEAWGLVLNEAAAAGLPIIAGDQVGSTCELLKEGENGWLVDSRDDEALASVLRHAVTMTNLEREEYGRRSRELVREFGPTRFANAIRSSLTALES